MKIIITESKLIKLIQNYLDGFFDDKESSEYLNFILFQGKDEDDDDTIYLEFDNEDGRLWIDTNFLNSFSSFFALELEYAQEIIKNWFETKIGDIEVKYVQS